MLLSNFAMFMLFWWEMTTDSVVTSPLTTGSKDTPYGHHGWYLVKNVFSILKKVHSRNIDKEWMQIIDFVIYYWNYH